MIHPLTEGVGVNTLKRGLVFDPRYPVYLQHSTWKHWVLYLIIGKIFLYCRYNDDVLILCQTKRQYLRATKRLKMTIHSLQRKRLTFPQGIVSLMSIFNLCLIGNYRSEKIILAKLCLKKSEQKHFVKHLKVNFWSRRRRHSLTMSE